MLLAGRTAVVTGGAQGIGAAIVARFRAEGAKVVIVDRVEVDLEELRRTPGSGDVVFRPCDVTDGPAIEALCASLERDVGTVAILVNNAGGSGSVRVQSLAETTDEIWGHVIDLNLTSTLRFCRALAPTMCAAGYGRIINMSSIVRYGVLGPGPTMLAHIPYVVSKGGIATLSAQLAKDLGTFGVTVNAIAPGLVLPGPTARVTKNFMAFPEKVREEFRSRIPMRRFGAGEDIASLAAFLASEQSEYLTGQTIDVDGGS